jgi:ribosomal protein L16/L10AE
LSGLDKETAHEVFRKASHKLPVRTRVVEKWEIN